MTGRLTILFVLIILQACRTEEYVQSGAGGGKTVGKKTLWNGKIVGEYTYYYDNGQKGNVYKYSWLRGKNNHKYKPKLIEYYKTDGTQLIKNGEGLIPHERDGKYNMYQLSGPYKRGKRNGYGKIKNAPNVYVNYRNGVKHGIERHYNAKDSTKLDKEFKYKKGEIVYTKDYHNGILEHEENSKTTYYADYYDNGDKKRKATIGGIFGRVKYWGEDGNKDSVQVYRWADYKKTIIKDEKEENE